VEEERRRRLLAIADPIEAEEARSRWSRLAISPTVPTTHQFTELATQMVLRTLPAQAYRRIFEMAGLRAPPREIDTPAAMATRAAILRSTDPARLLRERQRHVSNGHLSGMDGADYDAEGDEIDPQHDTNCFTPSKMACSRIGVRGTGGGGMSAGALRRHRHEEEGNGASAAAATEETTMPGSGAGGGGGVYGSAPAPPAGGTQWRTFSAAHHSVCACNSVVTQTINEEDSLVTVGRRMEGATRHCMEVVLRSDDPHGVSLALHGGRNIEIGVVAWGMLHPTEDDFIAAEIESDVRTPEEYFAQRPFMDPSAPHREWMVSTSSCTTGDTIQVILDLEAGALHFFKNGAKHGHGFPPGSVVGPVVFGVILCNEGDAVQLLRERQIPRQRTGYEPTKVTRCSCFTTKPGSGTPSIDPPGGGPPPLKEEEEEEEVRRRLPTPPASAPRLEALYEETTMKDERPGSGTPSIDPPGGGSYFLGEVKMREEEIPDGFEGDFTYPGHVDGYFPPEYATLYVDENMKHYYKDAQGVRRYTDDADADELQIIRAWSRRDADGEEHKWHKRGRTLDALLF